MNNNEKEALRWYLQGSKDGKTAKKNADNKDYEVACFLFQQAAEKLLKAFLYLQGESPVLGHSTLKLAQKSQKYNEDFQTAYNGCMELDIFYIPTRYPNGIPDGVPYEYFNQGHAQKAEKAYHYILQLIQPYFKDFPKHIE